MNRETTRMMQRQGQMEADGSPSTRNRPPATATKRPPTRSRTSVAQFFREIRDELRQVAWPSRAEVANYTTVVFTTLVLMIALIFVLNFAFGKAVLFLFQK